MAMQDKVVTATKSPLEKHAARVYTRGVFKRFKEQFVWSVSYDIRPSSQENHFLVIHMGDDKDSWGRREYDVEAIVGEQEFSCVCKLFEHLGILCRHILKVGSIDCEQTCEAYCFLFHIMLTGLNNFACRLWCSSGSGRYQNST